MIDLNNFTYYELEALHDMVESKIESHYSLQSRHPALFDNDNKKKQLYELTILKVKIHEFMKTLPKPSNIQRIKDGKRVQKY